MKKITFIWVTIIIILCAAIINARSTQTPDTDEERYAQGYKGTVTYGDNGPIAPDCSVRLCHCFHNFVKYDVSDEDGHYKIDLSDYPEAPDGWYHLVAWVTGRWYICYEKYVEPHSEGGVWTQDLPMDEWE